MRVAAALLACALALPAAAQAGLCPTWGTPTQAGELDVAIINEASGLEASLAHPGRLYHNNDSGDDLRFYVTDLAGKATQIVNLKGSKPLDIEEMSLGPCGAKTCLYLGDTGDNPGSRSEVVFTLVEEKAAFDAQETPLRVVRARYPDGPHNVEGFALHPSSGDLYVVTKPTDAQRKTPGPTLVYRLSANQLTQTEGVQVFTKVGEIDLPKLAPDLPYPGWIATALDISPDGKRAILLTYMAAVELDFDSAFGGKTPSSAWTAGKDYQLIRMPPLPQQEAVTWLPDASGFLYDTEFNKPAASAPLMKIMCAAP
jgi:hypothetical protein